MSPNVSNVINHEATRDFDIPSVVRCCTSTLGHTDAVYSTIGVASSFHIEDFCLRPGIECNCPLYRVLEQVLMA